MTTTLRTVVEDKKFEKALEGIIKNVDVKDNIVRAEVELAYIFKEYGPEDFDEYNKIYLGAVSNNIGEDNEWKQGRVLQFFSKDELLIGRDFWNFVCKSEKGYKLVLETYKENAQLITDALEEIKKTYLD